MMYNSIIITCGYSVRDNMKQIGVLLQQTFLRGRAPLEAIISQFELNLYRQSWRTRPFCFSNFGISPEKKERSERRGGEANRGSIALKNNNIIKPS